MLEDVVKVKVVGEYLLHLWFEDGAEGEVDIAELVGDFTGVFEKFKDPNFFNKVRVNRESGTIEWQGEIDLDPLVLYSKATGKPIELNIPKKVKVYG